MRPLGSERLWIGRPRRSDASIVGARERGEINLIARDPSQHARVRPEQADGALQDRVEHRLDIRLRAADDAQDVAGRGLRVQRRRQLAVALLQLGEEADVLDRDHGLVREGLEKGDLLVRKRPDVPAADGDRAQRAPITENTPNTMRPSAAAASRIRPKGCRVSSRSAPSMPISL